MTTTREEFEAWAKDRGHYLKRRADGVYMDSSACKAWDAWQAAHLAGQRAMQERAAMGCDGSMLTIVDSDWSKGYDQAIKDVSEGIRSLEVKPF